MRLVSIENKLDTEATILNVDQISCVFQDVGIVKIRLACGHVISTKFTGVDNAVDYILRAQSHSYVTGG